MKTWGGWGYYLTLDSIQQYKKEGGAGGGSIVEIFEVALILSQNLINGWETSLARAGGAAVGSLGSSHTSWIWT